MADRNTKVFISYSRKDRAFVGKVVDFLEATDDIEVFRDTDDILPTEEWKQRLEQLIAEADTVVFALSPHSAKSEVCLWEVDYAESLNKRVAPIVIRDVKSEDVPAPLAKYNYIFFTRRRELDKAISNLVAALNTDIEWIREHTRLAELARRWDVQRILSARLLRGSDLISAENWIARQPSNAPSPTILHREYLAACRKAATRRLQVTASVTIAALVVTIALGGYAFVQKREAESQRRIAVQNEVSAREAQQRAQVNAERANLNETRALENEKIARENEARALAERDRAEEEKRRANEQRDQALLTQSRFYADVSMQRVANGNAVDAILLSLLALPDDAAGVRRPYAAEAEHALYESLYSRREIRLLLHSDGGSIEEMAFTPDSERLLVGYGNGATVIWDLATGQQVTVLKADQSRALSLSIDASGKYAAIGSEDGVARVWNLETRSVVSLLRGHTKGVIHILISPDAERVVTSSWDKTVRLWDAKSGKQIAEFGGDQSGANALAISSDSRWLAIASRDETAIVGDTSDGKDVVTLVGHDNIINDIEFSPDNTRLVTASIDGTARLWDRASGEEIAVFDGHQGFLNSAAFSPDSSHVVTTSWDNTARLWDVKEGTTKSVLRGHTDHVTDAMFDSSGNRILTFSRDRTIRLWTAISGSPITTLAGHTGPVTAVKLSPDGRLAATVSPDGTVRIWNVLSGIEVTATQPPEGWTLWTAIHPSGELLASGYSTGKIILWRLDDNQILRLLNGDTSAITQLAFSGNGRRLAAGSERGKLRVWNLGTGAIVFDVDTSTSGIFSLTLSHDGRRLLSQSENGEIEVWNVDDAVEILRYTGSVVWSRPTLSPDGTKVLSSANYALLVDADSGAEVAKLWSDNDSFVPRPMTGIGFNADASTVAGVQSMGGDITLWDVGSGDRITLSNTHAEQVDWVGFNSAGNRLLTASSDRTAKLWNIPAGKQIANFAGHQDEVNLAAFSADNNFIVTVAGADDIRKWPYFPTTQKLVSYAKRTVPRCLRREQLAELFYSDGPPHWCIELRKWPYDADRWRVWLAEKRAGLNPKMPY